MIEELLALGFHFSVVVADSLYGEMARAGPSSRPCTGSACSMWWRSVPLMASGCCRANGSARRAGGSVDRVFTDGSTEQRCLRETLFGTRKPLRYYQLTTDPATLPPQTTWDLMTNLPGKIEQTVGNTFGLRTWSEYGLKPAKDDLGWADYRVTDAASIARWWELVMSAYTLLSLQRLAVASRGQLAPERPAASEPSPPAAALEAHPAWDAGTGWKHHLNNLRLLLQPSVCTCLLLPWLPLVPLPHVQTVQTGLAALGALVNTFRLVLPT